MNKILLFGAGKSATVLIDYLVAEAPANNWTLIIADADKMQIIAKIHNSPVVEVVQADITDGAHRASLVKQASVVISMMPPALHSLIAADCVEFGKSLLTASYLDASLKSLAAAVKEKQLLFIGEMGLDPGIDHMSAMRLIDEIKSRNGVITSFKSHCGGLVAPESDDNPWHYKISWNPRNVVLAGKSGAKYKEDGQLKHVGYTEIFNDCRELEINGLGTLAIYPNRDSLSYIPVYKLEKAATFLRSTLRYPDFCTGWNAIVLAGLTNDATAIKTIGLSYAKWSAGIIPFVNAKNRNLLGFLGLFDDVLVPQDAKTSADVLQFLLETKLMMQQGDKDMIVMLHEITYEQAGLSTRMESSLVVKGDDHVRTAMAKTVGLPLGIAAKLILNGTIRLTGIHIPTVKEIYEPVLFELEEAGIRFIDREL